MYTRVLALQKTVARYIAGIKPTDSCQESFVSSNILAPFSFYIHEISIFVKDECSCIINDKLNAHNCQYVHKPENHNSRPIIVGGRFYTKFPDILKIYKEVKKKL
jgi:hypothetical protein